MPTLDEELLLLELLRLELDDEELLEEELLLRLEEDEELEELDELRLELEEEEEEAVPVTWSAWAPVPVRVACPKPAALMVSVTGEPLSVRVHAFVGSKSAM